MFSRMMVPLVLVAAIAVAAESSVSSTCTWLGGPTHKLCVSPCCEKKPCCQTSQKCAGEPRQPFSTTTSLQKNLVALGAVLSSGKIEQPSAREISNFSFAERSRHSPEMLALFCIRLI